MNKAIDIASGDFVVFMNAGDTFVGRQSLSAVSKYLAGDADVVYGDRNYVKSNGEIIHQPAKSIDTVFARMPYCHQAAFVKLSALRKFPFNETYKFAADYNQVVELYVNDFRFKHVNLTVCNFAEGGKSESGMRPYLEVMKIQLDNAPKDFRLSESEYIRAFRNNADNLLKD
jgi:hypothetical protein